MGQSKAAILETIASLVEKMQPAIKNIQLRAGHLDVHPEAEKLQIAVLREARDWLLELHDCEFEKFKQVRALMPEEQWQRYEAWGGFDGHRELMMQKKALFAFRQKLVSRKRPKLFKKVEVENELRARKHSGRTSREANIAK